MTIDFSKPTPLSHYNNALLEVRSNVDAVAKLAIDGASSIPTSALHLDRTNHQLQSYNGSSFDNLYQLKPSDYTETGWIEISETWTYSSSIAVTGTSDIRERFAVGDRIRLKQGGGYKYFYVILGTSTLLYLIGGTSFTLANAAITDIAVARGTAVGFPSVHYYAPTFSGFSSDPTVTATFNMVGRNVQANIRTTGAGTSNSTGFNLSAPIQMNTGLSDGVHMFAEAFDNSAYTSAASAQIIDGSAVITMRRNGSTTGWTASGSKYANFSIIYPA